ncbi:hypothetical protein SBOR_6022 [Sclerotinia borealis F-4128]|uniref:Glutathione S-transferase n=1 Tax=Sclerotinia borealis (strain F-4128) TaxID=1432307 RepID=W9CCN9_SCLBF|nr:hypothetical protein SBOR_6022 [Sclerotinia borealis F-4128]
MGKDRAVFICREAVVIDTEKGRYAENMIETTLRLRRAIHSPDASLVNRILKSHPTLLHNPDSSPHGLSNTSLHLASSLGHLDVASLLLSLGHESLSISLNEEHQTALMLAACAGHTDLVNLLCSQGSAVSGILRRDMRGRDAIMYASRGGHDTCLQILLTCAALHKDPKEVLANSDADGNTALHFASSNGHMLVLRTLLAAGADSERRNVWMWTPMAYSATIQAEVYFKRLVGEVEKRKEMRVEVKVSSFPGFGRGEKKGAGTNGKANGDIYGIWRTCRDILGEVFSAQIQYSDFANAISVPQQLSAFWNCSTILTWYSIIRSAIFPGNGCANESGGSATTHTSSAFYSSVVVRGVDLSNSSRFYTAGTPNRQKVSITLEELGLKYETTHIDISKNQQKEDWYLKINPNGRIPAIIDRSTGSDDVPVSSDGKDSEKRVFEGGAILLYLTQKYDKDYRISYPFDSDRYCEVVEWVMWMQSGIGPMQGQANHFYRYAPEKIEYAIDRYQTETKRLYSILEARLSSRKRQNHTVANATDSTAGPEKSTNQSPGPWIVGDKLTIADLACFSWANVRPIPFCGQNEAEIDTSPYPEIVNWLKRINGRPAVTKGLNVPEAFQMKEKMKTKKGEEEYAKHHSNWVMKGQENDQAKHK